MSRRFIKNTVILSVLAITGFGLFAKTTNAQLGDLIGDLLGGGNGKEILVKVISDTSESSITTAIKTTLSSLLDEQSTDALTRLLLKEEVLDPAAWATAKELQQQLTGELLKWLGGQQDGQNGDIPFIQDYAEHYQNIIDQTAGEYLFNQKAGDAAGKCDPNVSHDVRVAVYKSYVNDRQKHFEGGALQCAGNEKARYEDLASEILGDFLECRDEVCAYFAARRELYLRTSGAVALEDKITNLTDGMDPQRICGSSGGGKGTTTNCVLTSPPRLAADSASFLLTEYPALQMLNMDEFDEIASNLMNNLTNQALQGLTGILGLTGNPEYSLNVFGTDGTLSYVDALTKDTISTYQSSGGGDVIAKSLATERTYYALQQQIVTTVKTLEDKVAFDKKQYPNCFKLNLTPNLTKAKTDAQTGSSLASTSIAILTTLNTQYTAAKDAATRSTVLNRYSQYQKQKYFHTQNDINSLKISFINLDFAKWVDQFKYNTATEQKKCGGPFDYQGALTS